LIIGYAAKLKLSLENRIKINANQIKAKIQRVKSDLNSR